MLLRSEFQANLTSLILPWIAAFSFGIIKSKDLASINMDKSCVSQVPTAYINNEIFCV